MTNSLSTARSTRRDDLVAVAARLFHESGYDATSMQEIANELGILKGSLYHYVNTKEDLLWMIVEVPMADLVTDVEAILSDTSTPLLQRIRAAVEIHCAKFEEHYPHMSVITKEWGETLSPALRGQLGTARDRYYAAWKGALTAGKESGELRSNIDPAITAEAILGMINWMFRWFNPTGRLKAAGVANEFSNLLERGLRADS